MRNAPVDPHTKSQWVGTYLQDNWVIGRRVTLNLGLRYQHDNAFVPEQCRPASTSFPTLFPAQCFDRVQFMVHNDFAGRAHFAWDLGGNGMTVIKGGWSRFRTPLDRPEVAGKQAILQSWLFGGTIRAAATDRVKCCSTRTARTSASARLRACRTWWTRSSRSRTK